MLLSGGVDRRAQDAEGRTPLFAAAAAGNETCCFQLLNEPNAAVLLGTVDKQQRTALHAAAAAPRNSVQCLRALLASKADVAAADASGATARQAAAAAGNAAAQWFLLGVEGVARAHRGRPSRAELLTDKEGELAGVYRLACRLQGAGDEAERQVRGRGACSAAGGIGDLLEGRHRAAPPASLPHRMCRLLAAGGGCGAACGGGGAAGAAGADGPAVWQRARVTERPAAAAACRRRVRPPACVPAALLAQCAWLEAQPPWAPVKLAAKGEGNWQGRGNMPVVERLMSSCGGRGRDWGARRRGD